MTYATHNGTADYFERFPKLSTTELKGLKAFISEAGFGTYRIDEENPTHKEALTYALTHGINMIDTSSNYGDGGAEKQIGAVLPQLVIDGLIKREEIVIMTKAGYIQGKILEQVTKQAESGAPYEEIVTLNEHLQHCMHPTFLRDQISESLKRMNIKCLDIFLIHNPEYYKQWAESEGMSHSDANKVYYDRIANAFSYLEEEVAQGRIKSYGISSNTFAVTDNVYQATSLEKVLDIAKSIGENHHFYVAQCPFNAIECQVALKEGDVSFLELAQNNDINVVINRPFNAISNNNLFRLTELDAEEGIALIELDDLFQEGIQIESALKEAAATAEIDEALLKHLGFIEQLQHVFSDSLNIFNYKEFLQYRLYPYVQHIFDTILENVLPEALETQFAHYLAHINTTCKAITIFLSVKHNEKIDAFKSQVLPIVPSLQHDNLMSHIALRAYRQTPGIHCSLIGMRHIDYVESILVELEASCSKTAESKWHTIKTGHVNIT